MHILYSFRRCPYAIRARMALKVAQVEVEHREISLRHKPDSMLRASPKGTVPVLILQNGQVIDESLEIMHWALAQNDPSGWLDQASDATPLITTNDGPFKHHLDRMKYTVRYADADPSQHRAAAIIVLAPLEARLSDTPYLWGASISFTDVAIFPFIRQFARADEDAWQNEPLPHLRNWLAKMIALPLFQSVMIKHPLWTEGAAHRNEPA